MPLVSWVEVIRFARNLRSDWPAVILTGYADEEEIADRPSDLPLLGRPREKDLSILHAIAKAAGRHYDFPHLAVLPQKEAPRLESSHKPSIYHPCGWRK